MHAQRKKTPLCNRNTLGLHWMQRCDFRTGFTVEFHRFAKVRAIAEKTLSWRYPNAADLRPNNVRCREELARGIALTALGRCTIMEFCDGLMKTIIGIVPWAVIGLVAAAPAARAQNPSPASSTPAAAKTADAAKNPTSPSANPGEQGARGDVYYYFTMGHVDEQQYELTGRAELATQAIESYKKALELAPASPVIRERLAEIYAKSQRLREAVEQAQETLQTDPNNVDAHRLLARIYVRELGDLSAGEVQKETLEKAIAQFQEILKIQPDDVYSGLWLARLYRFENKHSEAETVLRGLLARDAANGPALEQLSQLLMDEGRSQEAVKLLSDAAGESSSPEVYDLLGDAYSQAKDYAKAEDAYRKAVEEDPDDPGHLHGLAQALMAEDKYAEALEQLKRLTEIEPSTSENYLRMAQLYRRLGKFDQAEASLLRAKQLAPGSLEVLYNEALLYQDQGRYDDAVKVLSDAIAGMKSQSSSARNSAGAAAGNGADGAVAGESSPNALAILYEQLGHAYREEENYSAAIQTYQEMSKLGADAGKRAQMLLIDTYRESRDLDRAIAETKKALEAAPNDPSLTVTLAMLYGEKSDADAATKLLDGLLRGNDSDQEIYLNLAQVQERGKKYAEAEQSAQKAEQMARGNDDKETAWFMLGAIYERQKKFDQAEQEFRKALDVSPGNASVLNYYGYMLADRGVRLEEATAMIKQAVTQEPGNGAYLDSLGWAYYKQNKLTEAEENLRKANDRQKHDPTILGHLGDVYAKLGQSDQAAMYWERALAEWQKAVPADYETDKVNELDAQLKNLKRRTAQKTTPDSVKPQ
jgi:tetratricopeptide (TPR) repeat protein